jgi:hypothetical protein
LAQLVAPLRNGQTLVQRVPGIVGSASLKVSVSQDAEVIGKSWAGTRRSIRVEASCKQWQRFVRASFEEHGCSFVESASRVKHRETLRGRGLYSLLAGGLGFGGQSKVMIQPAKVVLSAGEAKRVAY